MDELIILEKPALPEQWDYDQSVKTVKSHIYKWRNLTAELARELYVAREMLSSRYRRDGTFVPSWSQYCQEIGSQKRVVNRWLKQWFQIEEETKSSPLLEGSFDLLYADPPWKYDFSETESRAIESHYPSMSLDAIKGLKVRLPASNRCVLFLWATAPKLREAMEVIEEWGFEYKTHAVWDKEIIGMGYWFRGQHELLLVATKGKFPPPSEENRQSSILIRRRGEHSRKPIEVYDTIDNMLPQITTKYELFARPELFSEGLKEKLEKRGWIFWQGLANGS